MLPCTVALAVLLLQPCRQTPRDRRSHRGIPPRVPPRGDSGLTRASAGSTDRDSRPLNVVATPLQIGKQRVECRPLHHVGAIVRAGAIPDRDHVTQIGGYLHTAAVRIARLGFAPDGTRQVSHHYSSRSASCFRYWAVSLGSRAASTARSNASR